MPICTTCTNFTPYLYTVYQSAYNLRLEQCPKCHSFADPYVEHDSLTLLLDLILLKRGVYRHLLYNRGTEPRRVEGKSKDDGMHGVESRSREQQRWILVVRLGCALIALDAFIRWSHLNPNQPTNISPWTKDTMTGVGRVLLGCCAETLAFHLGIMAACYVMLQCTSWVQVWRGRLRPTSDIKREFRFSLVPLTLLYSSLTKLFLLFLLSIWRPTTTSTTATAHTDAWIWNFLSKKTLLGPIKTFDEAHVDREWIIRNVLGGMSAGFGLRVVLDTHPIFTAIIILAGWRAKTAVANVVSGWVGGDELTRGAWRAYSIP